MESQTKQPKNNPTPDKILVLGIGNLVLNDEGIGIHVVNALNEMEIPQGVDVLDGGTGGLALLETLQSYRQLILVDAALDNNPVGTIRRLSPKYSKDYPPLLSAHEIGLKEMIDAMLLLGQAPRIRTTCHQCAQLSSLRHATIARSKKSHTTGIATYF